jgi:hypothetical protein
MREDYALPGPGDAPPPGPLRVPAVICFGRREFIEWRNTDAGWSSSVARWAHNPEVAGSNPAPATKARGPFSNRERAFCMWFVNGFVNVALVQAASLESPSAVAPWSWLRLVRDHGGG